jgi:DNA-binding transcriptional ArsR family regulator
MDESQALSALAAMSQETRLRIVRFLVRSGAGGAAAGEIGAAVGASSSRLSFHLSALEAAGLLRSRRVSRSIRYSADFDRLGALFDFLLHDCCNGEPAILSCCLPAAEAGPAAAPGGSCN